jgi:predicted O-methyltransferase YrrM
MAITKELLQEQFTALIDEEFAKSPPGAELPKPAARILGESEQVVHQAPEADLDNPDTWRWPVPEEIAVVQKSNSLMPLAQRYFLWSLVYGIAPRRYLEIGTDAGGSAMIVAGAIKALKLDDFHAVCIDPAFKLSEATREYLGANFSYIESKNAPAAMVEASRRAGQFDLVLVDGDHTYDYALADILLVLPYVARGGYILVDDAAHPQVRDAIAYAIDNLNLLDCGFMCRHTLAYETYLPPIGNGPWQGENYRVSGLYVLRKPPLKNGVLG